jgi:hypothetical protein
MVPKELTDQLRAEVQSLKEGQDRFLQTYKQLCDHCGGPDWRKKKVELVFHRVREEVIPIMEQAGADHQSVQALCSWAERLVMSR